MKENEKQAVANMEEEKMKEIVVVEHDNEVETS